MNIDGRNLIQENVSLKSLNTFKLESKASYYSEPKEFKDIIFLQEFANNKNIKMFVLGKGSNIIIKDRLDGLVICTRGLAGCELKDEEVILESGVPFSRVMNLAIEHNLTGFEGFWGIPASVGGALIQNAGGKFGYIGDIVNWVEVIDNEGKLRRLMKSEIKFDYRYSNLANFFIYRCCLKLRKSDYSTIINNLKEVITQKTQAQPLSAHSAGCIFKNPLINGERVSAGKLIEAAGLKGFKIGDAQVSTKHANFIINTGNATFNDIMQLIKIIKERVKDNSGIELELEVKVWE